MVEDIYEVYLESKIQDSERTRQLSEELRKTLCNSLGDEFFMLHVEKTLIECTIECRKEAFVDGFKAGVNLMSECYGDKNQKPESF